VVVHHFYKREETTIDGEEDADGEKEERR